MDTHCNDHIQAVLSSSTCYYHCSYDNLVVGCPLCKQEQGVVYYYANIAGSIKKSIVKIPAPSNQKGRFGISVESIGDLDRDGYNGTVLMAAKLIIIYWLLL